MSYLAPSQVEVSSSSTSSSSDFMSSMTSFFSSFVQPVHADDEDSGDSDDSKAEEGGDDKEGGSEESEGGDDESGGDEEEAEEEEEEDEPEDAYPAIYEACEQSKKCSPAKHHFDECQERVTAGNVHFKGEDCAEEFFHLAHCASECAAPKIFSKLV